MVLFECAAFSPHDCLFLPYFPLSGERKTSTFLLVDVCAWTDTGFIYAQRMAVCNLQRCPALRAELLALPHCRLVRGQHSVDLVFAWTLTPPARWFRHYVYALRNRCRTTWVYLCLLAFLQSDLTPVIPPVTHTTYPAHPTSLRGETATTQY